MVQVRPLFKTKDHIDIDNKWPISVLPTLSKLFEKSLPIYTTAKLFSDPFSLSQWVKWIQREVFNRIIVTLELTDKAARGIDQGRIALSIFLDLSEG